VFRLPALPADVSILHLRFAIGTRAKFKAGNNLQILLPGGARRIFDGERPARE